MATKEVQVAQFLTILAGKNGESQVAAVDESDQNEEFEIKKPKDWSKVMTIFVYNPDTKKFEEVDVMHCDVWKENRVGFRYQRESGETPSICDGLGEDESKFIFMIGSGTKPNSFYFEYANGDEIDFGTDETGSHEKGMGRLNTSYKNYLKRNQHKGSSKKSSKKKKSSTPLGEKISTSSTCKKKRKAKKSKDRKSKKKGKAKKELKLAIATNTAAAAQTKDFVGFLIRGNEDYNLNRPYYQSNAKRKFESLPTTSPRSKKRKKEEQKESSVAISEEEGDTRNLRRRLANRTLINN